MNIRSGVVKSKASCCQACVRSASPWSRGPRSGSGFLTGQVDQLAENDFRRNNPRYSGGNLDANRNRFAPLVEIARAQGVTPAQLALAWLLHQGPDIVPIPGRDIRSASTKMHGPQRSLWIGHCSTRSTNWRDLASPLEPPCSSSAVMATVGRSRSLEYEHGFNGKFPPCALVGAAALILLVDRFFPGLAIAQSETSIALVPENFSWRSLPDNPALESAWVLGDGKESRPYILRVKLAAGGRIPPHTHPDEPKQHSAARCFMSVSAGLSMNRRWLRSLQARFAWPR